MAKLYVFSNALKYFRIVFNLLPSNKRFPKDNKFKLVITFIFISFFLFLSLYWLKNQLGIGLSETISLSKYFPFNYLNESKIIDIDQNGVLLCEYFDTYQFFNNWHGIYIEGEGEIIQSISSSGRDTSKCLLIINREVKNWSISHNKFVEVNIGDHFTYGAKVKISAGNPIANIYVDAFDNDMKIVTWGYSNAATERLCEWIQLKNKFSIDDKRIKYIRLRISGSSEGNFSFDDVILKRGKKQ